MAGALAGLPPGVVLGERARASGSYRREGDGQRRSLDKAAVAAAAAQSTAAAAALLANPPTPAEKMALALAEGATEGNVHDVYTFGKTLGTGGYAQVKAAVHNKTGQMVAIKIITLAPPARTSLRHASFRRNSLEGRPPVAMTSQAVQQMELSKQAAKKAEEELKYICREVETLKGLDHPALMRMYDYYVSPSSARVYMVLELIEGGELLTALQKRGSYTEEDARKAFLQVLRGLAYLHERNISHRDLKLENLLLQVESDMSTVKLADFGMAKRMHEQLHGPNATTQRATMCGTPMYMAPEIVNKQPYTSKVDIWAAGVILYTLLTGSMPFHNKDQTELFAQIREGRFVMGGRRWTGISEEAQAFVKMLLDPDPDKRPSAEEALKNTWLTSERVGAVPLVAAQSLLREFAVTNALPARLYRDGETLIRQGERAREVFVIRKGLVDVFIDARRGGLAGAVEEVHLGQCVEGEYIGEFTLLEDKPLRDSIDIQRSEPRAPAQWRDEVKQANAPVCPITVRAAGDVEVVVFTREELRKILDHDKALNLAVLREAEQRLGLLERRWRAATMDGALVIPMGSSHGAAVAAGGGASKQSNGSSTGEGGEAATPGGPADPAWQAQHHHGSADAGGWHPAAPGILEEGEPADSPGGAA